MLRSIHFPDKFLLIVLLILVGAVEFWNLGTQPVKEFDEARFAANAFEMMQNHDYINLYYQGEPDTWVARPPLKAWLIIGGYQILGFNEWGLRLSSGIAIVLFFYFAFLSTNLYVSKKESFLIALILLSVKGIVGFHVGRNADMDAELICLLTAFTYYFLSYIDFNKNTIVQAGVFISLSFFLKTTACFYYLPGLLMYLVFTGRLKKSFLDPKLWLCLGMLVFTIIGWVGIQYFYGADYSSASFSFHENKNSIETMFFYDTWMRFTSNHFDGHVVEVNRLFFIHALDSIFNVWNYFFYAGVLYFLYLLYKKKTLGSFIQEPSNRFLLLSACVLFPIILLLTFGMHKLNWYTAPSLLFVAIFSSRAIVELSKVHKYVSVLIAGLLMFTLVRNEIQLVDNIAEHNEVFFIQENAKQWGKVEKVIYIGDIPQNVYTYLLWQGKTLEKYKPSIHFDYNAMYIKSSEIMPLPKGLKPLAMSNPEIHIHTMMLAKAHVKN